MNARSCRMVLLSWVLGACVSGWGIQPFRTIDGAEPGRASFEFDRADLPADRPSAWPKEIKWMEEYPRDKFFALMEQLRGRSRGPRAAWLKSAHYEATLEGDTLRGGLMTASVQRFEGAPSLLELGPFSIAFEELKWQDRPAIWGSASDGRVWVVTDAQSKELLGDWTARGRSFTGGIDFDLQLPLATTSFLDLRVPRGYLVYSPGEVKLLSGVQTEATSLWRIHCSSDSRCRVTCVAQDEIAARRRALLVEHDMHLIVRDEVLRFQLNLMIEALDAPVKDLILKVPAGLKIDSVLYGAETSVPFTRTSETEEDGTVTIPLPGSLTGRRRQLRIDGTSIQKPGQPVISPQIVVKDSTFIGGRQLVTVQSPLQVRSIRTSGYRQWTPLTPIVDGENFSFLQLTSNAQLILDVHRPPVSLSGQLLSLLHVEEDSWLLNTEIHWTSPTGGGFRTSCLFPPGWEVTDVQLSGDPSNRSTLASDDGLRSRETARLNWEVQSQGGDQSPVGSKSLLAIEFLEAIQPGQVRSVKVLARRRPPEPGQSFPVPTPQLVNCDTSDVILGIQCPHSMTLDISEDARLERIAQPSGTSFGVPTENSERRWYRGDASEGVGTFKLSPRLSPIQVRTETQIEALPSEFRMRYSIHYEPREPLTDRFLVYLTEPHTDVRWTMAGSPAIDLTASRLKKSAHAEWNLPSRGDLWEIRLPRLTGREVLIEGASSSRWSGTNQPALAYLPQAIEKLSQLKLTHLDSLELNFDANELKPTGQRYNWWYATPDAEFPLSLRNPEPSREFPLMVSMQLSTLMTTDSNGFDLYRARLQLENGSSHETLRFKLDPRAVLEDTIVEGESVAANLRDGEFVIPGLNAGRRDVVELIYRVPAHNNALYEKRSIIVPQVSVPVLGFFWEFAIPPSARIFAEPSTIRLSRALPAPTWYQRLFGPLGRSETESVFNPTQAADWKELFQPEPKRLMSIGARDRVLIAPAEWQRHRAVAPEIPSELSVELWHAARIKLLHWISLGVCLTLGIGLRMLGWKHRDRVAAYVLGLALAAAISASSPYAECLGGAVAGTLIALLIPRQILLSSPKTRQMNLDRPRTLPAALTAGLLGGITFFGLNSVLMSTAAGQESEPVVPAKRPIVYVPVDANGAPSEKVPLVYLPGPTLARWKELASERGAVPSYLISSAQYLLTATNDGPCNLTAKFRIHLLRSMGETVEIFVPLSDVSLPDAESCLVNGAPHPIGAMSNGRGYTIELQAPGASGVESSNVADQRAEDGIKSFDVELRLRMPRPSGSKVELSLPSIAKSHMSFKLPDAVPYLEVVGGRGASVRPADGRTVEADLGSASHVKVQWATSTPVPTAKIAPVWLLQHLELRPSNRELRFHLKANLEDVELDAIEFDMPADAVVRNIYSRADDLLRTDVIVTKSGQRRLRLVFDRGRRSTIVVDGTLLLLQSDSLLQTPLPQFGLASSPFVEWRYERNWWGVSSSADFRLDASNLDPENVNTISTDAYLQAWNETADTRHPESSVPSYTQSAFELRAGITPTFQLVPYQPHRRALQWKQIGSIGKRRLEWTLIGEIETTSSPTYQTSLLVDRRLRIEKISVIENGAERLTRWSENRADPSRVVLFLSDKPQAKQTITLRGSMPLRSGTPVNLPFVRPEDCEVAGGRLLLTREPEVDVTTHSQEWKADIDHSGEMTTESDGQIVVGHFQLLDPVPRGTIQTSSRHSRCSSQTAAFLRHTEGSGWKLTGRMEITPEGDSPMRMGLTFPASFPDTESVVVERAEPAWHEQSDGSRQLDLLLDRSEGRGPVIVQFEIMLNEPKQPDWEIPLPQPMNANSQETLLVIDPENIWFPVGGRDIRVADLPEWSKPLFMDLVGGVQAFRIVGPTVRIQRELVIPSVREEAIRLLDQRMWLHHTGNGSGLTQVFLSSVRSDLKLNLPSGVHITAMFLDENPLPLVNSQDRQIAIPMTDAGTESVLTFTWVSERGKGFESLGVERFPWPLDIRVEKNLITVLPENPIALWCRSGLTRVNSLDQGLDRLKTLLDRHSLLGLETRAAEANRWGIHQLQLRLLSQTTLEVRHPTQASLKRLERRNQLVESINQLESVPDATVETWQTRLMEEPVLDYTGAIRGHSDEKGEVRLWRIDLRWLQGAFTLLAACLLIPLFRRTIRIEWSEWLHRHIAVSWLLLATFWWLFLTPSSFGSFLLIVAAIRAATEYRPARRTA